MIGKCELSRVPRGETSGEMIGKCELSRVPRGETSGEMIKTQLRGYMGTPHLNNCA
jgi:hypothetical protein